MENHGKIWLSKYFHRNSSPILRWHDGRGLNDGEPSEAFLVTNGVKQDCVLAPALFSLMFSAMLTDAFKQSELGINIKFRSDERLFHPRRLHAVTKVKETVLRYFLLQMTAPSMPVKSRKCKPRWTISLKPAATSA